MSKMDDLRAMREAAHEQAMARAAKRGTAPTSSPPPAARRAAAAPSPAAPSPPTAESCGHRSMNGRTCTREQGHAAKNHRYS